ncbi:MAG: Holliday junction resolvase RuvX [Gemmataceae bacterium]
MTPKGRLLGVDFGDVRIGLAVSAAESAIAFPLAMYQRRDPARDADYFCQLVAAEQIDWIIVGLPIHLDGREGPKACAARAFGQWLAEVTRLPVIFWDERFTTVEAEQALWSAGLTHKQRKQRRDKVAAQILLQAYLDAGCPRTPEFGALEEAGREGSGGGEK